MKTLLYYISLVICCLVTQSLFAQKNELNGTAPARISPVARPAGYSATKFNYIRSWEPSLPLTDAASVQSSSRPVTEVRQTTTYVDGLGRPLQTVGKMISAKGYDVVTPVIYDTAGRERYQYFPYSASAQTDGNFKQLPFEDQERFYKNATENPDAVAESIYYGQNKYESSPLNKLLLQYHGGYSWSEEGGNKRNIETRYSMNGVSDSVLIWNTDTDIPTVQGYYAAGALYKTWTIDENQHMQVNYKDKEGHLILRKQQAATSVGTAYVGWHCTYYVDDDLDNLRFVIPPLAFEKAWLSNYNISAVADELCFRYKYDDRKRKIESKLPGAGVEYIVYDLRDRKVFTQNAVQRAKSSQEWLATFYDSRDRQMMTAIYTSGTSRADLQALMNNTDDGGRTISYSQPLTADLELTSYDGSRAITATNSITLNPTFETTVNADVTLSVASDATSTTEVKVNGVPSSISDADLTPLTYAFYDDYSYSNAFSYASEEITRLQAPDGSYPDDLPSSPSSKLRGLVTGTKERILGTDQWLETSGFYDDKGRFIQAVSTNSTGGKDITTNLYDFNGNILATCNNHRNQKSHVKPQTIVVTTNTYDAAQRLTSITKKVDDDIEHVIVKNEYDELGRIHRKRLHVNGDNQLDTLTYTYNLRGWLTGINKAYANSTQQTNWFGQQLYYDYGLSEIDYTGSPSGIVWKCAADNTTRLYGFMYDRQNRLFQADFWEQNESGSGWKQDKVDFTVSEISYDANGNILTLDQNGLKGTAPGPIDQLTYVYKSGGSNKLTAVHDGVSPITPKLGDFTEGTYTGDAFTYDLNGNLITDKNKGISSITYNYLNQPATITIDGKGSITYQYSATGTRVKKTVVDNTVTPAKTIVNDYIANFLYESDTLRYISHEEGRIRPVYNTDNTVLFTYDYFEKDHLGNVRVVLGTQTDSSVYAATMETDASSKENALFSNIDDTRSSLPTAYPADGTTDPNEYVAKLYADEQKIGPSIVLRVMTGDTIQLAVKAYYQSTAASTSDATSASMLVALAEAFSNVVISDGPHAGISGSSAITSGLNETDYNELKTKDGDENQSDKPKAYLSYVLFDDMFNMVDENSGVKQVQGSAGELQTLATDKLVMKKTGFIYIYLSNESKEPVYFDNLVVVHNNGPLLENTHYYPFGLTMAGISSNALKGMNYPENRKKYNGIEFTDDLDLDIYDAQLRNLDPQIGRWNQIDPKTENMEMWSPYASNYDNPIRYNDFLGDEPQGGPGPGFARLEQFVDVVQTGIGIAVSTVGGAANAYVSNNLLGVGRIDVDKTGLRGGNAIAYQIGQKVGDAGAVVTGVIEDGAAGVGEFFSLGFATPVAVPLAVHGTVTAGLGVKNLLTNPIKNVEGSNEGTRRKNRILDKGEPNSTQTNKSGTTTKKYGPDGNVQKEYNQGHQGDKVPKNERSDHVHDYKPNPHNPSGRGDRQLGRPPKKGEAKKDFGL